MKTFDVVDPNTGEVFTMRTDNLISDVRNVMLSRRRLDLGMTPWKLLPEQSQRDEITAMENLAETLVHAIVYEIAQAGRKVCHATLDSFTVKKGALKLVAVGPADDEFVLALNSMNKHVLKIAVADIDQFDRNRDEVEIIRDQPDLPLDDPGMTDEEIKESAAEMDAELDRMDAEDDPRTVPEQNPDAEVPQLEVLTSDKTEEKAEIEKAGLASLHADPVTAAQMGGQKAYFDGADSADNPFGLQSALFLPWENGFNSMCSQIDTVRLAVQQDHGKPSPYPKGSTADVVYNGLLVATTTIIEDDATASGAAAHEANVPLHANPYHSTQQAPLHRFWREGWLDASGAPAGKKRRSKGVDTQQDAG